MIYLLKLRETDSGTIFFALSDTKDPACYRAFVNDSLNTCGISYGIYREFINNSKYLGGLNHGEAISLSTGYQIQSIRFYCTELLVEEKIIFSNEFRAINVERNINLNLLKHLISFFLNIKRYEKDVIYRQIFFSGRYLDFIEGFIETELNNLSKHEVKICLKDVISSTIINDIQNTLIVRDILEG